MEITDFYSNNNVHTCPINHKTEYAFIGRSNVGKSSLINLLANKKIARTSSKPGKTQLIHHIIIDNSWALVDLPGYGYAKTSKTIRKELFQRMKEYLKNRTPQLVAVFILIDIRIPSQKNDLEWMKWLVDNNIYFIRVFTKCDNLDKSRISKIINAYNKSMEKNHWEKIPETIISSSVKKIGKNEIITKIKELNKLFQNI